MSKKLQTKNTFKQLGTALTSGFLLLGMAATATAADSGVLAGENSKNGARFYVSADPENSCAVTVSSNKNLRRFAFKDANGRTIRAGGVRRGQSSIAGFVDLLTANPNGQLSVRTRDGVWTRLNAEFSLAFNECIAPDDGVIVDNPPATGICQIASIIPTVLEFPVGPASSNEADSCSVFTSGGSFGFDTNNSGNNGEGVIGYNGDLIGDDTPRTTINFDTRLFDSQGLSEYTAVADNEMVACISILTVLESDLCSNFQVPRAIDTLVD